VLAPLAISRWKAARGDTRGSPVRGDASVGVVVGAVTVADLDGERARNYARRRVAMYLAVVGGLDPTVEVDPDLVAAIANRVAARDEEAAAALISDDVLDLFAFSGTPAQLVDQAEAVFAAGARRVDFGAPHGLDERTGVELLVKDVASRLGD